jgi:histone-lysine N-methyltransferase SETMAR
VASSAITTKKKKFKITP